MPGGGRVGAGGETVPERGGERGLQAGRDLDLVHHRRPALSVANGEHLAERACLGRNLGESGIGAGLRALGLGRGSEGFSPDPLSRFGRLAGGY